MKVSGRNPVPEQTLGDERSIFVPRPPVTHDVGRDRMSECAPELRAPDENSAPHANFADDDLAEGATPDVSQQMVEGAVRRIATGAALVGNFGLVMWRRLPRGVATLRVGRSVWDPLFCLGVALVEGSKSICERMGVVFGVSGNDLFLDSPRPPSDEGLVLARNLELVGRGGHGSRLGGGYDSSKKQICLTPSLRSTTSSQMRRSTMQDQVDLAFELKFETLCSGLFMRRVIEEARHEWIGVEEWLTDSPSFVERLGDLEGLDPVIDKRDTDLEASVFYLDGALVYLQLHRGQATLRVAGERAQAELVGDRIRALMPEARLNSRAQVSFWFWANRFGVGRNVKRLLTVPNWEEIAMNYPGSTREQLARLMTDGIDPSSGQLILWFGEPGCGKTYALRSLLAAWRDRFSFHYISDTDKFFGNSEYMMSVMLDDDVDTAKLFILEDSGEFLLPDARQEMGQGLSRLLNASDGLIGQGLKSMFLITTNESVGKLHPAVARPGRCAIQLEFGDFSPAEAQEWLQDRGHSASALDGSVRLADLYARLRGELVRPAGVKVGF